MDKKAGKGLGNVGGQLVEALMPHLNMKNLAIGAGGLLGFGLLDNILEEVVDGTADIAKTRYKALNDPAWKEMGKARLYGDYDDIARYTRAKEMLYNATYDKPLNLVFDQLGGALDKVQSNYAKQFKQGDIEKAFSTLKGTPEVSALGEAKAKMLYEQVAKIAPDVVSKAPGTALSVLQSAVASDSTALRPDMIYNLARAQDALN